MIYQMLSSAMSVVTCKKLSILIYHRVHGDGDLRFMEPTISAFDQQISLLKKFFSFYTLEKAIDLLATNSLPTNAAVITFDDGYRDNFTNALPILLKHGLPATFFVTTEFIGGGCMWNDRVIHTLVDSKEEALILPHLSEGIVLLGDTENRKRLALNLLSKIKHLDYQHREDAVAEIIQIAGGTVPSDIMMSIDEVIALRDAGMEIGGHTNTHPILTKLSEASSLNEMAIGKEILEGWLKEPVRTFAYPNGKPKIDYSNCHVQAAKTLGFKGAVSTAWGVSTYSSDIFQLPRFRPWDTHQWKFLARLLLNYKNTKPAIC